MPVSKQCRPWSDQGLHCLPGGGVSMSLWDAEHKGVKAPTNPEAINVDYFQNINSV